MKYLIITLFFLCAAQADAGEPQAPIPAAVLDSFKARYPTATEVEWEWDAGYCEAEFDLGNEEWEAVFNVSGKWIMSGRDIPKKDLPAAIITHLKKEYPGAVVKEAESCTHYLHGRCYLVEFKDKGNVYERLLSEEKGFLKMEE